MKTLALIVPIVVCAFISPKAVFGQGRVVINEFMAWSGCNTTSEFIELLNFGPGPMNIGCYIVTKGNFEREHTKSISGKLSSSAREYLIETIQERFIS